VQNIDKEFLRENLEEDEADDPKTNVKPDDFGGFTFQGEQNGNK